MFRVARCLPVTVVSPTPWFPLQWIIRIFRPHFRPPLPRRETQDGVEVLRPRYLSVPGAFKGLDGVLLALGSYLTVRRLHRAGRLQVLDAHFAYPDGYAATLLGSRLGVPVHRLRCGEPKRGTRARLGAATESASPSRVRAACSPWRRLSSRLRSRSASPRTRCVSSATVWTSPGFNLLRATLPDAHSTCRRMHRY